MCCPTAGKHCDDILMDFKGPFEGRIILMAHGFIGPHHLNPEDFMPSAGQFRQPKFRTCVLNLQCNEGAPEGEIPSSSQQSILCTSAHGKFREKLSSE